MADEIARLGVEIDATSADKAKTSLDSLTAAGGRAEAATGRLGKATGATAAELDSFQKKAIAATVAQTGMTEAQAAAALGFGSVTKAAEAVTAAHGKAAASSIQVRESLVLMREASVGNLTRMAGSASILAGTFGLMTGAAIAAAIPFVALAVAAGVVALAFVKGQEEASKFSNALAVTNGYSGLTASSFEDMAARVSKASDTGIGKTKANIEAMIASGKFTGDTIDQLVSYSAKLAQLTGQDSGKIVASFDAMKGSVVQFAAKHEETFHDLTLAQVDYIAELEKAGKHHEAELTFATDINTKVQTLTVQYGLLQNVMHGVGNAASDLWDKILGVGRPDTTLEKLNKAVTDLKAKSADMLSGQGSYGASVGGYTNSPSDVGAQAAVVRQLTAQLRKEQAGAAAKAKAAQAQDDAIQKKYGSKNGSVQRDTTDQRSAQVDAAIAQAQGAELQAQLALTTDIAKRADIEKQIAQAALKQKRAQTERQISEIATSVAEKHISAAAGAELTAKLKGVEATDAAAAALKNRLIDEQAADASAKAALDIGNARRDAEGSILQLQLGLVKNVGDRRDIELKLLDLATSKAEADAQAVIASNLATDAQKKIAAITLATLPDQKALQQRRVNEQALADLSKESYQRQEQGLQNQIDILSSQAAATPLASQRVGIDRHILALEQQIERLKEQEVLDSATSTDAEKALAQARLDALKAIQTNEIKAAQTNLLDSFDQVNGALGSMASAFNSHDWGSVLRNLDNVIASFKTAFGPDGTLGGKIGAVAGVANMIGGAVGGRAGGVISGAAGGAMMGAQIGSIIPGIGTAIGAVLGGLGGAISGMMGNDHTRDNAAKAAAQQALADQAQAATAALQKLQQQISDYSSALGAFYTASGQGEKALQYQRDQELDGLDEATAAIKRQTFAWEDYNTALKSANDNVSKAEGDLKTAYDAAKQALQAQIDAVAGAQEQLRQAYQGQTADLQNTISQFQSFSDSLAQFRQQLSSPVSLLQSPQQSLRTSGGALSALNTRIGAGDTSALGGVQDTVQAFVDAAKANAPDRTTYLRQLALAQRSVDQAKALADAQVSVDQQQLDALKVQVGALIDLGSGVMTVAQAIANLGAVQATAAQANQQLDVMTAQVSGLIQINASVITVAQAILNLHAALAAKDALTPPASLTPAAGQPGGAYTSTHGDYTAYVMGNPDLVADFAANGAKDGFSTMAQYGQFHWEHWGALENRAVRAFALGGSGVLGGMPGVDANLLSLNGNPIAKVSAGEFLSVTPANKSAGDSNAALLAEVRAMRMEMAAMRADGSAAARHAEKTAKNIDRAMGLGGGKGLATVAA